MHLFTSIKGIFQLKYLYAEHVFGWEAEQISEKTPLKRKLDDFGDMLAKVITGTETGDLRYAPSSRNTLFQRPLSRYPGQTAFQEHTASS